MSRQLLQPALRSPRPHSLRPLTTDREAREEPSLLLQQQMADSAQRLTLALDGYSALLDLRLTLNPVTGLYDLDLRLANARRDILQLQCSAVSGLQLPTLHSEDFLWIGNLQAQHDPQLVRYTLADGQHLRLTCNSFFIP